MSIYDSIKARFVLPNAHEDWKDYRDFLTGLITELGGKDADKTVSVIGAGRCNDIDLKRLCACFKHVTLFDYDSIAMGQAIKYLNNPEIRKMYIVERSLTGIGEKNISAFCDKTISDLRENGSRLTVNAFSQIILNGLEDLHSKMFKSDSEILKMLPKSDIVLCNGVFSQLFSMISFFIRSCAASLPDPLVPQASEAAARAEEKLKEYSKELIPLITKAIVGSANDLVIFGNEYSECNPVEGACRCIECVRNNEDILEEKKVIWEFNRAENLRYEMLIQIVKGKGEKEI